MKGNENRVRESLALKRENVFLRKEQQRLEEEVRSLRFILDDARKQALRELRTIQGYAVVLGQLAASAHHMVSAGRNGLAIEILSVAQSVEAALLAGTTPPIGTGEGK